MKVQATKTGYFGHMRRKVGSIFDVGTDKEFSEKWMKKVVSKKYIEVQEVDGEAIHPIEPEHEELEPDDSDETAAEGLELDADPQPKKRGRKPKHHGHKSTGDKQVI